MADLTDVPESAHKAQHGPAGGTALEPPPADQDARPTDRGTIGRLVLGSALMLFTELALIRWLGANVVHLSYFSNFVLLGFVPRHRDRFPDRPGTVSAFSPTRRSFSRP